MNKELPQVSDQGTRRLKWTVRIFFWLTIFSMLCGAWVGFYKTYNPTLPMNEAQRRAQDPMTVTRHLVSNGQHLVIPVPYFKTRIPPNGETKDVLLIVMYPDFSPLKETPQVLWEKGLWDEKIVILLMSRDGRQTLSHMYESFKNNLKATEHVSNPYGLEFYTEPRDGTRGDLYLEKRSGELLSLIECSEDRTVPNPQCTHWVWGQHFIYHIRFDKDLLPHWHDIQKKSVALIESFKRDPATLDYTSNNTGE